MAKKKKQTVAQAAGAPMWMATFADMMALLMTFFVMLLALSEVDKAKFETLGISMKMALGTPVPVTAVNSSDEMKPIKDTNKTNDARNDAEQTQTKEDAQKIVEVLDKHMSIEEMQVETKGKMIIVRMLDTGVFQSGSATIKEDFKPVLAELRATLKGIKGEIVISGHTDDIPISNQLYRSNWELSADRSYSVIQELIKGGEIPKNRFVLQGFGETRPLIPNKDMASRSKNRRVELIVDQRDPDDDEVGARGNAGSPATTAGTASGG